MNFAHKGQKKTPPLAIRLIAIATMAVSAVVLFAGAWSIGTTWDERHNALSLQTFFDYGWNVSPDGITNGAPDPTKIWGIYVYGPVSELIGHFVSVLAGAESWGTTQFSADSNAVRHIGIALISLLGVVGVAATIKIITRSWWWGVLGSALLMATPIWVGHAMFNIKDSPVAVGYVLATMGVVALLRDDYRENSRIRWISRGGIIAGSILAAGTRAAIGVPIAAGLIGSVILWWLLHLSAQPGGFRASLRPFIRRLGAGVLSLVIAYGAMVAIYPKAFWNPIRLGYEALIVSTAFPFNEPQLTAGTWMEQPVSWSYLPLWLGAQLPLLVLAGTLIFVAIWLLSLIGLLRRTGRLLNRSELSMTVPLLFQGFAIALATIVTHATLFNGYRHYLFMVPAFVILATLGIWVLCKKFSMDGSKTKKYLVNVLWVLVGIGLISPVVAQIRLFPYSYTYFNPIASIWQIDETWPTDYWRSSGNELIRLTPPAGEESCWYEQVQRGQRHSCLLESMFVPYSAQRGENSVSEPLKPGQYWLIRENQGVTQIPIGCSIVSEITRPLYWRTITIGQVLKCEDNAVVLPVGNPVP